MNIPNANTGQELIAYVFGALLSNALKYTDAGGMVTVSASAGNDLLSVPVVDIGRGIPARLLNISWSNFFSVPGQITEKGRRSCGGYNGID